MTITIEPTTDLDEMLVGYESFLETKRIIANPVGFTIDRMMVNPMLFPFQGDATRLAVRRGRCAIFAECGLGKSGMQIDWARIVLDHLGDIGGNTLILAPLAVSAQTSREGEKFGTPVTVCRDQSDVRPGINITNYERIHLFDPSAFGAIVIDESSILKGYDSKFRAQITAFASGIQYRLACTATPAPNDTQELINHAEFLGIMSGKEILALFFTQDGNTTHKWRLKGHARADFWKWVSSWAIVIRKPSDLGYSDDGFILPELRMHQHTVSADVTSGMLFAVEARTLQERRQSRRDSISERMAKAVELVNQSPDDQWIIWTDLNIESQTITKLITGAVEITGSDTPEHKEQAILDFVAGTIRVLVSKPTIAGFGVNLQNCSRMIFIGLNDSFESLYQAIRRCWRFGQMNPVDVYVITSDADGAVVKNIERKERQADEMMREISQHMTHAFAEINQIGVDREEADYDPQLLMQRPDFIGGGTAEVKVVNQAFGDNWALYHGDSIDILDGIPDNSIGLSVFSPPFPGMYVYQNSARDIGNSTTFDQLLEHYKFLIAPDKLLRAMMPGRTCAVHLTQGLAFKGTDGYIGVKDFRGKVIQAMEDAGWIYYGEVCIDKNPQIKAIRTKDRGLLFKTLATDSSHMHMALADYLLQFRKPGDNPHPIPAGISEKYKNEKGWITPEEWIEWAAPVWYRADAGIPGGIRETDVLNVKQARETDDERHLAPLQLGVIERAVKLWSAPGEIVFDPFNGIGSSGFRSLELGRKYIGGELKESYFRSSIRNLQSVVSADNQLTMF